MRNFKPVSDNFSGICNLEFTNLTTFALPGAEGWSAATEFLFVQPAKNTIAYQPMVAKDIVRIGSKIAHVAIDGFQRTVDFVCLATIRIDQFATFVPTSVRWAIIGLRTEQSMFWIAHDDAVRRLQICGVSQNQ